jgi:hypothetical protein
MDLVSCSDKRPHRDYRDCYYGSGEQLDGLQHRFKWNRHTIRIDWEYHVDAM